MLSLIHISIYNIHFPQSQEALRQAQYRLKFDELLGVQLNIQQRRTERLAKSNGFLFTRVGGVFNTFYTEKLPFPLTGAQKRVIREIRRDTVTGFQMNRLLQGDVGSGKTLVALMSMLLAVDKMCIRDRNLYGGIYREAELILTERTAISPLYLGSDGVLVHPQTVGPEKVEGEIEVHITSKGDNSCTLNVDITRCV